jgi:hypothetical protein
VVSEVFPTYEDHQARTDREIPVIILERSASPAKS